MGLGSVGRSGPRVRNGGTTVTYEKRAAEAWEKLTTTQQMAVTLQMEKMTRRVITLPQDYPPEYEVVPT